jgi:hypothetical protein
VGDLSAVVTSVGKKHIKLLGIVHTKIYLLEEDFYIYFKKKSKKKIKKTIKRIRELLEAVGEAVPGLLVVPVADLGDEPGPLEPPPHGVIDTPAAPPRGLDAKELVRVEPAKGLGLLLDDIELLGGTDVGHFDFFSFFFFFFLLAALFLFFFMFRFILYIFMSRKMGDWRRGAGGRLVGDEGK